MSAAVAAPASLPDDGPRVVLSARGLRRDFAGFVAVKDVDLDVNPDSPYQPKRRL